MPTIGPASGHRNWPVCRPPSPVPGMDTLLIALASFIPMLLLLVVVHELGHFWTAKAFGVKVLEFGVGYPPRAFGIYTGRTEALVTQATICLNGSLSAIKPGQVVRILSGETDDGNLVARYVEIRLQQQPKQPARCRFPSAWQAGRSGNGRIPATRGQSTRSALRPHRIGGHDLFGQLAATRRIRETCRRKQPGGSAELGSTQRWSTRHCAGRRFGDERPVSHCGLCHHGDGSAHRGDRRNRADH